MTPQAPSAAKTRILETALDLFNAEGVGALSAMDIAAALGISPGTVGATLTTARRTLRRALAPEVPR